VARKGLAPLVIYTSFTTSISSPTAVSFGINVILVCLRKKWTRENAESHLIILDFILFHKIFVVSIFFSFFFLTIIFYARNHFCVIIIFMDFYPWRARERILFVIYFVFIWIDLWVCAIRMGNVEMNAFWQQFFLPVVEWFLNDTLFCVFGIHSTFSNLL
jgi:hypothetical protein